MNVYVARQPILDRGWNIAGYEVFICPDSAGSDVIANALDRLQGDEPAFVNFGETFLTGDSSAALAPEKIVVEIPASVAPKNDVFASCERLRREGYPIALKTSRNDGRTEAFAPFVDVLKVDFQSTSPDDRAALVKRYRQFRLRLIAENVASDSDFQAASRLGYDFLQGLFFTSPSVLRTSRVPASNPGSLRLLKLAQQEDLDFHAIADVVRHDLAFSHSLLKYLNSAAFHWASEIESVQQALLLLGSNGIRKWVWMASLPSLAQNRPPVLVSQVLMRGRFCEALAEAAGLSKEECDPFLTGMFSLLDAILQKPLPEILDELNVGQHIRRALLGAPNDDDPLSLALRIVKSYERADFQDVGAAGQVLGLASEALNTCYLESLHWVGSFVASYEHTWPATGPSERNGFHRERAFVH